MFFCALRHIKKALRQTSTVADALFLFAFPMLLFESREAASKRISRRILMRCLIFPIQLWPENPTYQVYVPGYHSTMPQQHLNGRARSVSPQEVQVASKIGHSSNARAVCWRYSSKISNLNCKPCLACPRRWRQNL